MNACLWCGWARAVHSRSCYRFFFSVLFTVTFDGKNTPPSCPPIRPPTHPLLISSHRASLVPRRQTVWRCRRAQTDGLQKRACLHPVSWWRMSALYAKTTCLGDILTETHTLTHVGRRVRELISPSAVGRCRHNTHIEIAVLAPLGSIF